MNSAHKELKEVILYTDGGCEPNPGPGGYGVVMLFGKNRKELSGGFKLTTNNRMEIYATIAGLEALKYPCKVKLYSDSKYVVDAMTKGWVLNWREKGWRRNNKEKAVNPDLWERLLNQTERHQVEFIWVKGHAGFIHNERCDELAMNAMKEKELPLDEGYMARSDEEIADKISTEGQPCRKCSTPVIRKISQGKRKPGQTYYYEYYLQCPKCGTIYHVEEAKRTIETEGLF